MRVSSEIKQFRATVSALPVQSYDVFLAVGGYDERLSSMEDFAMDRSARKFGSIARTASLIRHDEGDLHFMNACRKKARYAAGMATFARLYGRRQLGGFLVGRSYLRLPLQLMKKPTLGAGVIVLKTGEAVAVGLQLVRDRRKVTT